MDLDSGAVWALTQPGVIARFQSLGLGSSDLDSAKAKKAYSFIESHADKYGDPPSISIVYEVCDLQVDDPQADPGWILSQLVKRKMFRAVQGVVHGVSDCLRRNDPEAALGKLQGFIDTESFHSTAIDPTSLFDLAEGVVEKYQTLLGGQMGVPFPWDTMNHITMGLWEGTATYFVARPGTGKTQVAVLIAHHAWNLGHKVLIITPEMSKEEIAERYFTYDSGISGTKAIRGTLSAFELDKLRTSVTDATGRSGAWVLDSADRLTPETMEAAIDRVQPDLVAVDSIYMLQFRGNKAERTEKAVDWIRSTSKRKNVPFVCFHQMNRTTVKDKKFGGGYDTSNIALSDQLLWDAHAVFLMEQGKDMKDDRLMRFHVGKVRRGAWDGEPIDTNWNFDTMNFSEVKKVSVSPTYTSKAEGDEFTAYDALFDD